MEAHSCSSQHQYAAVQGDEEALYSAVQRPSLANGSQAQSHRGSSSGAAGPSSEASAAQAVPGDPR